jgi:hypothetical protein
MSVESIKATLKVSQKTMGNGDLVEVSTVFLRENVSVVQVSIDHGDPNKVITFTAMSRTHQVGLLGIMQKVEDSEIKAFLRATLCSFL